MRRPFAAIMIAILRVYRVTLSPGLTALGIRCRHEPSCSRYGIEALQKHGGWAGFWLGLSRFIRCNPFGSAGYDPVPLEPRRAPWYAPWLLGDWRGPKDVPLDPPRDQQADENLE